MVRVTAGQDRLGFKTTVPIEPVRRAVLLAFTLLAVQGMCDPTWAHDGTVHSEPGSTIVQRHSLLKSVRPTGPAPSPMNEASKTSALKEKGRKKSLKQQAGENHKTVDAPPRQADSKGMSGLEPAPVSGGGGMSAVDVSIAGTTSMTWSSRTMTGGISAISSLAGATPAIGATSGTTSPGVAMGSASSVVRNSLTPPNKGIGRLSNSIPGLMRVIVPPLPPDAVAQPAPPLGPPASGLPAAPANWFGYHVLNRLTFGGTPNQLNAVSHMTAAQSREWAIRYMKEQLGLEPAQPWPTNLHATSPLPNAIPIMDTDTDYLLAASKGSWRRDDPEPSLLVPELNQIQDYDLIRKIHSRRQLLEKMVYFWDNHFNTDYRSHFRGQYEVYENEAFRELAYGRFVDLLTASGKSAAMMVYLNTDVNRKENPNENYAREVFELHTLGVDEQGHPAGYAQADIVEAAKAFTGWTVPAGVAPGFRFLAGRHSPGTKTVLGQVISFDGAGPGEGERVLQLAASHPSTARHLAKKLCEYFVSETPSPALIAEVASVFADSGGDIRKVLIAIVTSPDFNDVANYRSLVKTPLEYIVGLYRNLGVWSSRDPFRTRLTKAGQGLFEMPPPTGYKEKSEEWLNTHVLFHETAMAYEATISGFGSTVRYGSDTSGALTRRWLKNLGLRTEEDVLGFLLNLTTDRIATATEYQVYLSTLRSGGTFNLESASSEAPLDRTLATILANPRYLYQ